jgi:PAS domain-containing protein
MTGTAPPGSSAMDPPAQPANGNGHAQARSTDPPGTQPNGNDLPAVGDLLLQVAQLQGAIAALQRDTQELRVKRNNQAYLAQFAQLMRWQPADTLPLWADRLLQALAPLFSTLHADLYVMVPANGRPQRLRHTGSYARRNAEQPDIEMGQGLVGQAAKTRQAVYIDDLEHLRLESATGLAHIMPRVLLVQPLVHNEAVEGVLELSSLQPFTDAQLDLIAAVGHGMAANLNSIQNQLRIEQLYKEAQEKTQQLSRQEEVLRANVTALETAQAEMRRAQAEAEFRARQLAASQVIAGVGSWELDPDTDAIECSENMHCLLGVDGTERFDRTRLRTHIHPADLPLFDEKLQELLERDKPMDIELRLYCKQTLTFFALRAKRMADVPGMPPYVLGTAQDISARKQQEAIIQQQNEELVTREEELRQNFEELQAMQDSLRQKAQEIEKLKAEEQENAVRQKEKLKELMEKLVAQSRQKEAVFAKMLAEKDAELEQLRSTATAAANPNSAPAAPVAKGTAAAKAAGKKTKPKAEKKKKGKKK